jgi:hypothetical protein
MSLPIISITDSSSIDLQPWLLVRTVSGSQIEVSLWSIDQVGMSMAIFSSLERAEQYRSGVLSDRSDDASSDREDKAWKSIQPTELELGQIMVAHYRAGVKWLVLDPSEQSAKRVFSMPEVLKALRTQLAAQA